MATIDNATRALTKLTDSLPGAKVRAGHRASLFGVLGAKNMIPIRSSGKRFMMKGHFPYRGALQKLSEFAQSSKGKGVPSRYDYENWARDLNNDSYKVTPEICIAQTGDEISRRTYMALIGGANHEGFHRLYSGQGLVYAKQLQDCIAPFFKIGVPYHQKTILSLLAEAQNVFEDIRIERIGCAEFPGVHTKMADLADFVLDQEEDTRKFDLETLAKGKTPPPARIALAVFREVGLGYSTVKTRDALTHYKKIAPKVVELVRTGALAPFLKKIIPDVSTPEAIEIAKTQVSLSTSLAIEFVSVLYDLSIAPPPPPPPKPEPKPQPAPKPPKAPPPPPSDDEDEEEPEGSEGSESEPSEDQDDSETEPKQGKSKSKPEESEDSEGDSEESEEDSEDSDDSEEDSEEKGSESKKQDSEDDGEESKGSEDDDSEDDDSEASKSEDSESDDDEDEDDSEEDDSEEDGSEGEGSEDGESEGDESEGQESGSDSEEQEDGGKGAGNGASQDDGKTAGDILNSLADGLLDYADALEEAVKDLIEEEQANVQKGEKPYRPLDASGDKIIPVTGDPRSGRKSIEQITKETKKETAYLRSKLRNMFRALETGSRIHGVRKGKLLSERYLVDTFASIRGGSQPSRAFSEETETIDTSIAAYIVVDESTSMDDKLRSTSQILYTLADGLDSINAKFAICGFRQGTSQYVSEGFPTGKELELYHRTTETAIHDLFKGFEERFKDVAWKLSNLRATGGTPMADGVELALRAMSTRKEGHRVIFVVTDGSPDGSHAPVLRSQIRRAREAGIQLIGVGLGVGSEYVKTCFPDSVFAYRLDEIPNQLVEKLESLVLEIGTKGRGKTVKETTPGGVRVR